jgi:hypothetical protein
VIVILKLSKASTTNVKQPLIDEAVNALVMVLEAVTVFKQAL